MTISNIELVGTSPLAAIEALVVNLSPTTPKDNALTIYDRVKFYAQETARIKRLCEQQLVAWIQENGDMAISDTARYYIAHPKDVECLDAPGTLEAVIEACQGDYLRACEVLASGAIKHGAAKKILPPEVFARLFKVTVKDKLETGAAAPKKLQKSDETFLK